MADVTQVKRWKISETLLKRAHQVLPHPEKKEEEQFCALEKEFFEYLEHNEHELALDMLQELGELVLPCSGFWQDLIRAAENMGLSSRTPYFEKMFHETLGRLQKSEKNGAEPAATTQCL